MFMSLLIKETYLKVLIKNSLKANPFKMIS